MKRLLAALAVCTAALAATACSSDEAPAEEETEGAVEAVDEATEAETEAESEGPAGDCGDETVTAAMAELIAVSGVELSADDSAAGSLSCTWDTGSDAGALVTITVTPTMGDSGMTEELLESMSQEVIEDARFEGIGAIPTVVLGCDDGTASSMMGCAVAVYGPESDITVQALLSDATQEQILDAAWALTEASAG
ncbi:hypothetical protein LO763_19270 [Glycomyces sp. A-F 0318]|uniref:hypothetical protein n=1 Tax=Glycomyces amatae TaxID=2881355 RepID=UPI001E3565F9|nr:hypothetical protein [Glycomyces amatae]MCD0445752.1 hypothetical protein [Glycomyces amatae]